MKYLITLDTPTEAAFTQKNAKEAEQEIKGMMEQLKPEVTYFSAQRRHSIMVVNVEDPHIELRGIYEAMSKWGQVTIDLVSTPEEFFRYMHSIQ